MAESIPPVQQVQFDEVQVWTPPADWQENPEHAVEPPVVAPTYDFELPPMRPIELSPTVSGTFREPRRLGCLGRTLVIGSALALGLGVAGFTAYRATAPEIPAALDACAVDDKPTPPASLQEARQAVLDETFIVEQEHLDVANAAIAEATTNDEIDRAVNEALSGRGISIFYHSNEAPPIRRNGIVLPDIVTGVSFQEASLEQSAQDARDFLYDLSKLPLAWYDATRLEVSVIQPAPL